MNTWKVKTGDGSLHMVDGTSIYVSDGELSIYVGPRLAFYAPKNGWYYFRFISENQPNQDEEEPLTRARVVAGI